MRTGEYAYLRNGWNIFDFALISAVWLTFFVVWTEVFNIDENVAFVISVLRRSVLGSRAGARRLLRLGCGLFRDAF